MAQQMKRWNPGDAANAFVRVILSDAGARLGGLTETEWDKTLLRFDWRCAYTGEALVDGRMDRDHAIPMNRTHCGLHLYGNVLPATKEANRQKAGKHYRDFVEDPDRLERIESFVRESGYWEQVSVFGDLQRYCEAQYRSIDALCRVNRQYLDSLLPEHLDDGPGGGQLGDAVAQSCQLRSAVARRSPRPGGRRLVGRLVGRRRMPAGCGRSGAVASGNELL